MKKFVLEFLELLNSIVLFICFAFVSFLLILNFYHFNEISYKYNVDLSQNVNYDNFKKDLDSVKKKIDKVDYNKVDYSVTAKPIHEYFDSCINSIKKGTFYNLNKNNVIDEKSIYDSNNEILKEYNNTCMFSIAYNISSMYDDNRLSGNFKSLYDDINENRKNVISYANYLTDSELGNSSYSFSTYTFKSSIYNSVSSKFNLTIKNYSMMVSILDDLANWYVDEFGGNS